MDGPRDLLLVFARHPEEGRVKTRLARGIGKRRAWKVYRSLLRLTLYLARAQQAAGRGVRIWITPACRLARFRRVWGRRFVCHAQRGGDLGARLRKAFDRAWREGASRVVVIGSDCPGLTPGLLGAAFRALGRSDAVIGPARDGGYYLLGLSRPAPEVFERIPWGTDRVFQKTLGRLRRHGLACRTLRKLVDVDTARDLRRVSPVFPK
jgi:rSAM/selenodomain-associated transferase 1